MNLIEKVVTSSNSSLMFDFLVDWTIYTKNWRTMSVLFIVDMKLLRLIEHFRIAY